MQPQQSQRIQISGADHEAVAAVSEFISRLEAADFPLNPFRDEQYKFKVVVDQVNGDAFVRYLMLSFAGRPSVTVRFTMECNSQTVLDSSFTSATFFQDSRDTGFRGGAFGGSNKSFIRTNCRKIVSDIVNSVSENLQLIDHEREYLREALNGKSGDVSTLKWMGATAGVLALLFSSVALFATPVEDRIPAVVGGLITGMLFGSLIGFVLARVAGLFGMIARR